MKRRSSSGRAKAFHDKSCASATVTSYLQAIRAAYGGEILGRSFFCEMSDQHQNDLYARRAFWLLSRLELEVGRLMRELLQMHEMELPAPEQIAQHGRSMAQSLEGLSWNEKLTEMSQRIDPALVRFDAVLIAAPKADKATIELLVEHERALATFVQWAGTRRNIALREAVTCLRRLRLQSRN